MRRDPWRIGVHVVAEVGNPLEPRRHVRSFRASPQSIDDRGGGPRGSFNGYFPPGSSVTNADPNDVVV